MRLLMAALWSVWALPAIKPLATRTRAMRGYLWIASVGRGDNQLRASLDAHAEEIRLGLTRVRPVIAALDCWSKHRHAGHRVILISGSLTPLARAMADWCDQLCGYRGAPAEAFGSDPVACAGGWSVAIHRHSVEKRALLESLGAQCWDYAYSDSWDDAPLLRGARFPVLVAPSGESERAARLELGARLSVLEPRKR